MIFNIVLVILFVLQTVLLLVLTIVRNREIDREIEKSDDFIKNFDFAKPYKLMWDEWYQNQFKEKKE